MEKLIKMAPGVIIVVALALMLMLGRNILDSRLPALGGNYYKNFKSDAELEYRYSQLGEYEVDNYQLEEADPVAGEINVWYPKNTGDEKMPMIIVANPSKLPATNYKPFFERLASWGFVVVGNEDPQSGTGKSVSATLEAMKGLVDTHPLRDVIDYDTIGIIGYSQGGAGALAAVTEYDNGSEFDAIFTGSAVAPGPSEEVGWIYDTSRITVPYFMTAGTGDTDAGTDDTEGAAPLTSLMDAYISIGDDIPKIRARAAGTDHNDMLKKCDGYMTAWMLYELKGDEEAAKAFVGDSAEILENANWQDVDKNS
ncbi:MAG: alpha/beta hydrolase [Firmicutes bacterium]|nr:alpha/beta hydrolase [Bacillota bacterium]